MRTFEIHEPRSIQEATSLLALHGDDARIIAGGTALVIMLKNRMLSPGHVISLGRTEGLRHIRYDDGGGLRIGAMTTIREVERSEVVRQRYPTLGSTFGKVANVRVRHAATVGGNLAEADYASDPPCALVAARARIRASSPRGEREIPLTEFFTGFYETALQPDEILTELVVPPPRVSTRSAYIKYVTRSSEDRPCLGVAASMDVDTSGHCQDLRVVVGAVAEKPQEVEAAEGLARGQPMTEELARAVANQYAEAIDPLSDLRGSAWYRKEMIRVFVREAILEAVASPSG